MSDRKTTYNNPLTARISRVNWGAILAGGLTALAISLLLNLLGTGIGFASIDPMEESNPLAGLGVGTAIWWTLSNLVALLAGGWIAGRTSGFPNKVDGGIHGFLAWGFYATVSFFLLTSTISSVLTGVGGTISNLFGGGTKDRVVVELNRAQQQSRQTANYGIDAMKADMYSLINTAERYNVLPNDASEEVRSTINNLQGDIKGMNIAANVDQFMNNINYDLDQNGDLDINVEGDYFDKNAVRNYLTENTELSDAEINGVINKWEKNIDTAVDKAEKYYARAKTKVVEFSDKAAEAVAIFCISAFFALILGAIAAFFGGEWGSPRNTVTVIDPDKAYDDRV